MAIDLPRDPKVLISVPTSIEAAALVLALKDYGIDAQTVGGYTSGFQAESPGEVQILVKAGDWDAGKKAIEEIRSRESPIDWSQVDVGEPED